METTGQSVEAEVEVSNSNEQGLKCQVVLLENFDRTKEWQKNFNYNKIKTKQEAQNTHAQFIMVNLYAI
jgi:hypothetical protein